MKLTKKEKLEIFLALLDKYPSFERNRKQVEEFFVQKDVIEEHLKIIDVQEKKYYQLMKKFGDEVDWKMPKYISPANRIRIEKLKKIETI